MVRPLRYYIEDKNGSLVVEDGFKSLTKAREIARYFVKGRYELRIVAVQSGHATVGYIGKKSDGTIYYADKLGYEWKLNRNGSLGDAIPYKRK